MIIKRLKKNVYDVCFSETGWDLWARFERSKGHLRLIKGAAVPSSVYSKLIKEIIHNARYD